MENTLGWPERANQAAALKTCRGNADFGGGQWTFQMDGEAEPSLGSLDGVIDQRHWAHGDRREMEDEHDGREPEDSI